MTHQTYIAKLGPDDAPYDHVRVRILRGSWMIGFILVQRLDNGDRLLVMDRKLIPEDNRPTMTQDASQPPIT